ncbi:required for drug-induced death protein 1 isoform X1 [Chaetodon trifascialis]|uniref:required for drug-induced death protein 1 isoform X1 n=2 Tax=Chaetodon trifascialis TaxID=109706 RepID=UPI00399471F0
MSKLTALPESETSFRLLIKSDSSSLQRSSRLKTEEKKTELSPTDEEQRGMGAQEKEEDAAPSREKKQQKTSKEVYFSVLPDRYEPLIEEVEEEAPEERRRRKEEKKRKKKQRYKKYRKNVGKALRFSWRCLMAGLQSMAAAYSTPASAVSTVMTEVHRYNNSKA